MLILGESHTQDDSHGRYRVTQKVSPRVMIIELTGDTTKEQLQTMPGVDAILEPGESLASEISGNLSPIEAAFVAAYTQRSRPKTRQGDGLNWDAEGFVPPDLPSKF